MSIKKNFFAPLALGLGATRRAAMLLLVMMLTTVTTWADDVNLAGDSDIAEGTAGHYYVNMPVTGTNTLTITADDIAEGKGTFKVYDDGGKGGQYSNDCNGNLVLQAPEGYLFEISGSVTTDGGSDKLTVYNGSATSSPKLLDASGATTNINTSSTSNFMTLNFTTNAVFQGVGFDLTVTLVVAPTTDYNVIINTAEGGSVTASPTSAKINEAITLTATPGNEYMLSGISVKDADNNDVVVTWDGMFINTATFTMPGSDVTVTPTFTNDLTNLSVNMPKTGEKDVIIPSYVQSFKVYDDGGKDGNYSQNCTGTLVLTAPEGYVLQLSGSVTLDYNNEKLTVYNGTKANDDKLIDAFSCSESDTKTDIPMATSKGNVMTIYFETNNFWEYAGLDLTVTLVSASTDYTINGLGPATGGSISASVGGENATTAKANDVVTLTATPESNYLFNGISVKDADNNDVVVTWDGMFINTATFTMPGSNVTITPTFTNDLTNLSVNMPKTGSKSVTIPSYVQSIKVYDDGGSGSAYSPSCDGTLVLTAPTGYLLQLSGSISSEKYHDMLTVYDNSEASGTKLIDEVTSPSGSETAVIYPVFSSGNVMTLKFVSDSGWNYDGFDLTVTIVNPNTEYNVNVVNPAEGGSVTASPTSAKVNATVTLTATPDNEYLPSGFSVKDANNNDIAVTWDGPFSNTATFTMPGSNVTVTPTFSDDLTNLYVNMPKTGSKSITIPSGVQSFKVYDDGGSSSDYSTSCNGTLVLTAPTGYVLQLSGGITTEGADKLTVYDNSEASGTKLIDAMGGSGNTKTDIEPVTSSSNVMTINFKSDNSINYAGLDLTVTLFKDIAACDITVPNQTLEGPNNPFDNISYKFEYVNTSDGRSYATKMGIIVKDGDNTLTLGTDYTFGSVKMANGDPIPEKSAIGDECMVEIVGQGNYDGSKWETFKIVAPDAGGTWGDNNELTWAFHDGTLTISPTENVQAPVAMKETNAGDYPWFSSANYINTITIGEGVSTVADDAFNRMVESNVYGNVKTVNLPSTLTTIGAYAFAYCTGATITIPESVTTLGANPFNQVGCVVVSKPLVDGNDNSDMISKMSSAKNATFTYKRSFTDNVASTVCLPFDYTPQGEGKYYTFTAIDKTTSPWTVTMTTNTVASLTANTPYMFMPVGINGEVTFTGTASSFDPSNVQVNDPVVTGGKWNLIGTYESRLWDNSNNTGEIGSVYGFAAQNYDGSSYTVNPGDFVKAMAGASIAPFRAFLKFTPVSGAPRRGAAEEALPSRMTVRLVNADGDVTAIGTIDTKTGEIRFDSDAWYTLDGRRLNGKPAQKGVYINNGKKIIVK